MFKKMPASKAYRLLESGPVVMVSTRAADGRENLMTLGFHMMMQHEPALVGAVIGPWDHSYEALQQTGECVLAIPTVDLAKTVIDIGNCSGAEIDKFNRFGLTALPASDVRAPLVEECLANIECKVADTSLLDRYNLFIMEVKRIWINHDRKEQRLIHHEGDGRFIVDGRKIDLSDRMVRWKYLMDQENG
jgi:flavin reductase (DIM6/NTAB) family NADH-FMN oxidoreductase RutF